MRLFASKEEREATDAAEAAYHLLLDGLRADPARLATLADDLQALFDAGHRAHLPEREAKRIRRSLLEGATEIVLADDRLTAPEEASFDAALTKLGVTAGTMEELVPGLAGRLVVARVNDGRLPVIDNPRLLARPGETVHLETVAQLTKMVAVREFQAGSRGVSLRIMKGVSYRVGSMRGRMVTVGSELRIADEGILSVTDRRIVFSGSAKTLEFRYDRLVSVELYTDGIQFGVTNRQTPSVFRLGHVHAVAAVINAAAQAGAA